MTLGQRIQEHRLRLELSQEGLGEKLGVSRQAVSKWEADAAVPETDKLISLSKLFGLTLNELLQVEGPEKLPRSVQEAEHGFHETPASAEPSRSSQRNGAKWLMGGLTAFCLVLGVGLIWMGVRLTALEERVAQQSANQDTLNPANLVGDWDLGIGSDLYRINSTLYRDVPVTVVLTRYDPNQPFEVFFQTYGSGLEGKRVEAKLVEGTSPGVYSAQVPVQAGNYGTLAVVFRIDGVEYLQPLVEIDGMTDNSISGTPLLEQAEVS